MKVVVFDFDDTLFHTPVPKTGHEIFKQKTGKEWPYRGWWGRKESLDTNIFDIPINKNIFQEYIKYKIDPDNLVILATGRLDNLRPELDNILNLYEIKFDQIHMNPGMDTLRFKLNLFSNLLKKYKPTELVIFDDRDPHLQSFRAWADNQHISVNVFDAKQF
jgi:FMN phosphatase YigB (HAD superfamily)